MPRKGQKDLEEYDPHIRKLGWHRFHSGEQLFNSKTHKLRAPYESLSRVEQREVLLCGQLYGKKHRQDMRLYAQEKRLLAKIFKSDGTAIVLALAASLLAATLVDTDSNGVADLVQCFVTQPARKTVK